MVNKKLRTQNEILKKLNETYYVLKNGDSSYNIYDVDSKNGIVYRFTVSKTPSGNKTVIFNGEKYKDTKNLLDAVDKYNSNLEWPYYTYDPMLNENYRNECRIDSYLRGVLKMESNGYNKYIIKDTYGNALLTINVFFKQEQGFVSMALSDGRYVDSKFSNAEEGVKAINSILMISLLGSINNSLKLLKNIKPNKLSDGSNIKVTSIKSWLKVEEKTFLETIDPLMDAFGYVRKTNNKEA